MKAKKGRKVKELKRVAESNSLETPVLMEGGQKAPGQTGIHSPGTLNAIRKPTPNQRKDGPPFPGAGVSKPRVSPQTFDCYRTPRTKPKIYRKKT